MDKYSEIKSIPGLSLAEVAIRAKKYGLNEISHSGGLAWLEFIFRLFREPMFLLLILGATLYFILGDKVESLLLLFFVVVIMGITFCQEYKSDKAITALRNLSSPRAFVIRAGHGMRIAGRDVVPDDIVVISEGDLVPADAVLLSATNLLVDESTLTGESNPVRKIAATGEQTIGRPGGDDLPFVYSGSQVIQGNGYAKVVATGAHTEIGKIGKSLEAVEIERTSLQKETDSLVRNFAIIGFAICIVVAIIYGVTRADWLHGLLTGIALAMAVLPEEFPVVLTVFLALGARRIARQNVLTRRIPAIEVSGATTVLCVDKTGTITQNSMTVKELFAHEEGFYATDEEMINELPEEFHSLIEYGILASNKDPFDPMDIAIKKFGEKCLNNTEHLHEFWEMVHQYPLSKELLALSQVWKSSKTNGYVIAAKGAPEAIFDLCHLAKGQIERLSRQIEIMADKGLRIIGVAKAHFIEYELPEGQHDFNFEFLGLIGLADPIRPGVSVALQSCYNAGIRVIMLTGDYVGTALRVAEQIGLKNTDEVINGPDLAQMSDLILEQKIKKVNIFARILPEQKLRIVNALKENGEIVTMTGDGVNDAPALKAANIGVAMGAHGTDVAREAAALILLDDAFSSLVKAIRIGRRIYDNIKKASFYLLAVHIPIIGMTLIPVVLKLPLVLLPIHIVFIEVLIDLTCSIVFEAEDEEETVMLRPPRSIKEKLFSKKDVVHSVLQGCTILFACLAIFFVGKFLGYGENTLRAVSFSMLVVANMILIFINRSRRSFFTNVLSLKNRPLWIVLVSAIGFLSMILCVPWLRALFHFEYTLH